MNTLVTAFGDFLGNDNNSSEEFIKEIPNNRNITKLIFPAGYFKKDFIKPIKKYKPGKIFFLGMHEDRTKPAFETVAKNEQITLKNPIKRVLATAYVHLLKWQGKNFRTNEPIPKEQLTIIPIKQIEKKQLKLKSAPPKYKNIEISKDAGNYVCNYSMWVAEEYLREHNIDSEFYFIHLPPKLSKEQKKDLITFITT